MPSASQTPEYRKAWKAANPEKVKQYRAAARQRGTATPPPHCVCGAVVPTYRSTICKDCRRFIQQIAGMRNRAIKLCGKCRREPYRKGRCVECVRAHERSRWSERVANPEKLPAIRARRRVANGRRRAAERMTNLTAADIRIQMKRTYCSLCRKRMTDESDRPNSKHHDHIIPVNVGGTHTWENTRVICRTCNLSRPKDGSDVTGQIALWQAEPAFAPRERVTMAKAHRPLPLRIHCMPPAPCACGCGTPTRYGKRYVGRHRGLRGSKYEHLYPAVRSMLSQGHRSKRIAASLGVSRDTAREIMTRIERVTEREISHA